MIQAIEKIELPSSGPTSPEKHAEQEQQLRTVLGDYAMSLVNKGMSPAEAADYIEQIAPLIGEVYAWAQQNQFPDGSLPITVESGVQPAMAQAVILGVTFTVVVFIAVAEEMRKNGSNVSDAIQKVFSSGRGVIVKNDPDNPDQPKVEIGPTTPERGIGDNGGPPMDEDPENGGGNNQGPIYPAPLTAKEALDRLFKEKTILENVTGRGTRIESVPNGTQTQADNDFDKLALSDVRPIQTDYGPARMGTLPDGTTVLVRPSRDGRPTIEFQRDSGRTFREIRYGSK